MKRRAILPVGMGQLRLLHLVMPTTATSVVPLPRRPVIGMLRIHQLAPDRGLPLLLHHLREPAMTTNVLTVGMGIFITRLPGNSLVSTAITLRLNTADDLHHQSHLVMPMTIRHVRQVLRSHHTATGLFYGY